MIRLSLLCVSLLASHAAANEIVLKDGKRIAWKVLTDKGDSVEIEAPTGRRLIVEKAAIESVVFKTPPAPLAGATFTRNGGKTVTLDVLALVDVKRDTVAGQWKRSKGGLTGQSGTAGNSRIQFSLPVRIPEEYDLAVTVERKGGAGDFEVGMLTPSRRQFELIVDGYKSTVTGLWMTEGKLNDPTATAQGPVLQAGVPRRLVCMVRKAGFLLRMEDKDAIVWTGDWEATGVPAIHAVPRGDAFFFVCSNGTFEISKMSITYAKE